MPGEPRPLPCTTRTQRMPFLCAVRMNSPSASRASSTRRPCRSSWRWMLQCPARRRRVTSTPMPGRRKLSWSSVSSRVLTSKSSLIDSRSTRCSSRSCCTGRGGGRGRRRRARLRSRSRVTGPTARLNWWRSASRRAAASRRAFSSASRRACSSRRWRATAARSCRSVMRTLARRGAGALLRRGWRGVGVALVAGTGRGGRGADAGRGCATGVLAGVVLAAAAVGGAVLGARARSSARRRAVWPGRLTAGPSRPSTKPGPVPR